MVVKGAAKLTPDSQHMAVIVGQIADYLDQVTTARSYGVLRHGECKVDVCL